MDPFVLQRIASFLETPYHARKLRAAFVAAKRAIVPAPRMTPREMFKYSARVGSRKLCREAVARGAEIFAKHAGLHSAGDQTIAETFRQYYKENIACLAARRGHYEFAKWLAFARRREIEYPAETFAKYFATKPDTVGLAMEVLIGVLEQGNIELFANMREIPTSHAINMIRSSPNLTTALGKSGNIPSIVALIGEHEPELPMHYSFEIIAHHLFIGAASTGHRDACEVIMSEMRRRNAGQPNLSDISTSIKCAIRHGFAQLALRLREFAPAWVVDGDCAYRAGKSGNRDAIIFVFESETIDSETGWRITAPHIGQIFLGAASKGHVEICKWLIELFAKFKKRAISVTIGRDSFPCTLAMADNAWQKTINNALWLAAMGGHRKMCEYLRECGARTDTAIGIQKDYLKRVDECAPFMVGAMCAWICADGSMLNRYTIEMIRQAPKESHQTLRAAMHRCERWRGLEFS